MRRAVEKRIAVGGILQIFALCGCASLLWQDAYTTVRARRLYLSRGRMRTTTEALNQRDLNQQINPGLATGEKGKPWRRVPPGFQP